MWRRRARMGGDRRQASTSTRTPSAMSRSAERRLACEVDLVDLETERRGGDRSKVATVATLKTREKVADEVGVSPRTAQKAITVKKSAPAGSPASSAGDG